MANEHVNVKTKIRFLEIGIIFLVGMCRNPIPESVCWRELFGSSKFEGDDRTKSIVSRTLARLQRAERIQSQLFQGSIYYTVS